ncbi:MAG: cation diffusion facilitator family transporter [Thiotrichales bacterium]|nr:cation diffusion facilitator family transporter [Thiotrichales bacterium]
MNAQKLTRLATYLSVSVALTLMLIKGFAWWETGSVGVLASLLDSTVDVVASVMILVAVHIAQIPADNEHRFGHGKAEPLASLGQSIFIAGSALYLMIHAVDRLIEPEAVTQPDVGMVVMVLSMLLSFALILFQRYVIARTASTAIKADSLHYLTDILANFAVLLGLWLAAWFWVDATLGLLIGLWIGWEALKLAYGSANELLDKELPENMRERIREIVLSHPQVEGFNDLRTYRSGPKIFIQLDLELDDHLSLLAAHEIAEEVTRQLQIAFEEADILIHQEPVSIRENAEHHQWEMQTRMDFENT